MSQPRPTGSIAGRISLHISLRLLRAMAAVNLITLILALGAWGLAAERRVLGERWQPFVRRGIESGAEGSFRDRLGSVLYVLRPDGKEPIRIPAGAFLQSVFDVSLITGALEVVFLGVQFLSGRKRTERLLAPLTRMAESARRMVDDSLDAGRFRRLETAIANLSPKEPDVRLRVEDRDLKGLGDAVNSLMARMHESYRQQIRFVSDASHELRTPIAVIRGYAGMLERWGKDDRRVLEEGIEAIRQETEHMQKLVEQLLFLARGDAGLGRLSFGDLDLAAMMGEVFEEYRMLGTGHAWRLQAPLSVPAWGDAALLKQTARILCDNARQYAPAGSPVTLRCWTDPEGTPCFSVQDNGEGIPVKDIPRIFDRFYRGDPARSRRAGGTGLGLSIARWIVDSHGGYFDVFSREGLGTRVSVCLPAAKPVDRREEESSQHPGE